MPHNEEESRKLEEFLESLPLPEHGEVSPEGKDLYLELIRNNFVPKIVQLSEEIAHKGEEFPLSGKKQWYGDTVTMGIPQGYKLKDYLSVSINRFISPKPLSIKDKPVGNIICEMSVFDGSRSVRVIVSDDGHFAFQNDNDRGEPRLIETPDDLLADIPSHPLFPVGNPAGWLTRVIQQGIFDKFDQRLASLPPIR